MSTWSHGPTHGGPTDRIRAPSQGHGLHPRWAFFGGGFPYKNRQKKVGTLILTSLLEDLDAQTPGMTPELGACAAAF